MEQRISDWMLDQEKILDSPKGISPAQAMAFIIQGKQLQMDVIMNNKAEKSGLSRSANIQFDMFNNYGCYCQPTSEGLKDGSWIGTGEPVDEIDSICQSLFFAYQCLKKDYGDSCSIETPYEVSVTKKGKIVCSNSEGTCAGDLCRLDISFIDEINEKANIWSENFHANNGFDRVQTCSDPGRAGKGNIPGTPSGSAGKGAKTNNAKCCGKGLERQIFHPNRMECCDDQKIREIGTC